MEMGLGLDVGLRQEFRIGPAQLLLSELLPLPVMGLAVRLDAELDANPALELPEPASCPGCGHPAWDGRCVARPHLDRPEIPSARPSWREDLLRDVAASLPAGGRRVAANLLADVDGHGVLDVPLPVVAQRLGVGVDTVLGVIDALRRAGFPGLCAGSLVERLRLQVAAAGSVPPEVGALLGAGLDALAGGSPTLAARASGLRTDQLDGALAWLRARVASDVVEHVDDAPVRPVDLVVRRGVAGLWPVVVPGPWSAVRVAESYLAVAADPRVRGAVAAADRFVTALGRRERALQQVSEVVVRRQAARLTDGPGAHRSLTRREVALELGVHESTVSRVVAGKHAALPSGETVELASLFGAGHDVQQCLREVVGSEVVALSDAALSAALARRGHSVARRTVAKYRAQLGIADRLARSVQLRQ